MLSVVVDRLLLAEVVLPVPPAEEVMDDLSDLKRESLAQLLGRDHLLVDQDLPEPLQLRLLGLEGFGELPVGDLAALDQDRAEPVLEGPVVRVRRYDAAREEG